MLSYPDAVLLLVLVVGCSGVYPMNGADCRTECNKEGLLVPGLETEDYCSITMPDNPYIRGDYDSTEIAPCKIEIQSNCTDYCQIELNFKKFDLPGCGQNLTNTTQNCDIVDSCEYILLHETGLTLEGSEIHHVTHFHGYLTQQRYVSKTNKIWLQFCYRSETFSGRNIQVQYRAVDPTIKPPFYAGPVSVYVMCFVALILASGIGLLQWSSTVRECLDPPDEQIKMPCAEDV